MGVNVRVYTPSLSWKLNCVRLLIKNPDRKMSQDVAREELELGFYVQEVLQLRSGRPKACLLKPHFICR